MRRHPKLTALVVVLCCALGVEIGLRLGPTRAGAQTPKTSKVPNFKDGTWARSKLSCNVTPRGELQFRGELQIVNARKPGNPRDAKIPIQLRVAITNRDTGERVVDEILGRVVDEVGKGNWSQPVAGSYLLHPGNYTFEFFCVDMNRPTRQMRDGTTKPNTVASSVRQITVR